GDVRTVGRRTAVPEVGGESDLVVNHNVNCATRFKSFQFRHLDHLVYDALRRNGGVAVDEDRGNPARIATIFHVDFGPYDPFYDRVHRLEVRRVWYQAQVDVFATVGFDIGRKAQVILHVATKVLL